MPEITIHIDDRERNNQLHEVLKNAQGIQTKTCRLETGDYWILPDVIVERKTIDDFCASLIQNRLFHQASRLQKSHHIAYLIVEGSIGSQNSKMKNSAIRGALIALTVKFGLHLLYTETPQETAKTIIYLGRQKYNQISGTTTRSGYKPKTKRKQQLYLLQSIPEIGPKRANLLLKKYSNIRTILNTPKEEIQQMDGIGKKVADSIENILEETQAKYTLKAH